jgi:hypothetical protein
MGHLTRPHHSYKFNNSDYKFNYIYILYIVNCVAIGKAPGLAGLLLGSDMQSVHDESHRSGRPEHTGSVRSVRTTETWSGLQLQSSWSNGG